MSNPIVKRILDFYEEQGLTMDYLASMPDEDWASLTNEEGTPLTLIQKIAVKAAAKAYKESKSRPKTSARTAALIEELERKEIALKEVEERVRDAEERKRDAVAIRKVRISDCLSRTREKTAKALRDVQRMVHELSSLGSSLDICFCIDATGSMSGIISSVKQCIVKVAQRISASTGMVGRFALVVYRDYCDKAMRHQIWDFSDSSTLETVLGTVTAQGGGDGPEDCFGGLLAAATRVTWRAPSKVIVWMGDAPQHGRQYTGYTGAGDDYPGGDPDGVTSSIIFERLRASGIILVFCKLTESTNTMAAQLRLEVAPFGDSLFLEYNIGGDMADFLASTVHTATSRTFGSHRAGVEKTYIITPASWTIRPPIWGESEPCKILTFQSYSGGDLHPLLDLLMDGPDVKTRKADVFKTVSPVDRGEMRLAYYCRVSEKLGGYDYKKPQKDGVLKESRFEGEHNSRRALINQAHIQAVAQFLAQEFTSKLSRLGITKIVKYVSVELLQVKSSSIKKYFSFENFIPGTYLKFNNNNGFVDKTLEATHPILQTFSHFTYSYSRGLVMVTDVQGAVQGNVYLLTDPAIHTADPRKELPDPTNLGPKGFSSFFATHTCNDFCRRLALPSIGELDTSAPLEMHAEMDSSREVSGYEDDFILHSA
jgi:hypothetical protein